MKTKFDKEKHLASLKEKHKELRKLLSDDKLWGKTIVDEKGVKVFTKKVEGSKFLMIRGVVTIPKAKKEKVDEFLLRPFKKMDVKFCQRFNKKLLTLKMIEKYDDNFFCFLSVFLVGTLVKNREFVNIRLEQREDKGIYVCGELLTDKEEALVPLSNSKNVRGSNYFLAFSIVQAGEDVIVDHVQHVNPKGWIPSFFVNLHASNMGKQCVLERDEFQKWMKK